MRKIDLKKDKVKGMAAKTINFEMIVLEKLEERVKQIQKEYPHINVSNYVNRVMRKIVLNDVDYWREQEKHHRKLAESFRIEKESVINSLELSQC